MRKEYGIHWFRRDLRVAGNQALMENWKATDGRTVGVFCFDKKFLGRDDFSWNRFQFFIDTLIKLQKELRSIGSDLLFMDVGPSEAFPKLIKQLEKDTGLKPGFITWNRDYEPYARKRDQQMSEYFSDLEIPTCHYRDHLLIEPHELSKKNTKDEWYQVYTPFSRQWLSLFADDEIEKRLKNQKSGLQYLAKLEKNEQDRHFKITWNDLLSDKSKYEGILQDYRDENAKEIDIKIPEAGSVAAYKELKSFAKRLNDYADQRDIPSLSGTSKMSIFLKNGSITVPQIIAHLGLKPYNTKNKSSRDTYFSELIWREFYYHILYHQPEVENLEFLEQYRDMPWANNKKWFAAWKEGRTGFPIVDAGMRQLNTTGWMHNRVRMIVASFLTKDLLIDWRWGEKYFMEKLLDGDIAANNGGWQWAASTGCDAQPYFRIFNPWTQGKRFDPKGEYIRTYLPELNGVSDKDLHKPIEHDQYPKPIVDHKQQREKALQMYKEARG